MPAFAELPIPTERLVLRPYRESDAQAVFGLFSDPKVMRYMSTPPWTAVQRARDVIARDIAAIDKGETLSLAIERTGDARLIGQCVLYQFSETCRRAEIGYSLVSSAWGNGYMHEALCALIDYGFGRLDLNRIEADIDPRNEASARSLDRLGFVREGLLRERWIVGGEVSDSLLYGLLRSDWRKRSPERA